jgi:hypothetical protein
MKNWLGWQDSNLRMTRSKPVALPLGDTPLRSLFLSKSRANLKSNIQKKTKNLVSAKKEAIIRINTFKIKNS